MPRAKYTTVTTAISGCLVGFGANLAGDPPFTYDWDFGPFGGSSDPTATVSLVSGTHPYTLTVFNCQGAASDSHASAVTVECAAECLPVTGTDFGWVPLTVTVGRPVTFTAVATSTPPLAYAWDFGDGTTDTGATVLHTYTITGTYSVTVMTSNPCGQDDAVQILIVAGELPGPCCGYYYLPLVFRGSGP